MPCSGRPMPLCRVVGRHFATSPARTRAKGVAASFATPPCLSYPSGHPQPAAEHENLGMGSCGRGGTRCVAASLWCVPYERSLRNIAPSLMSSPTTPIPSISTGSSRRTRWRQDGRHALALFDAELPATDRGTLSEPPNLTMSARTTPLGSARWALRNMRSGGERRLEAVTPQNVGPVLVPGASLLRRCRDKPNPSLLLWLICPRLRI